MLEGGLTGLSGVDRQCKMLSQQAEVGKLYIDPQLYKHSGKGHQSNYPQLKTLFMICVVGALFGEI